MNELVSVIVPVYNVAKYLPKCIDSILNQTYRNLEVLLVDDGSTDESGRICDEYAQKDSRIRVFHKENGGQSTARNFALDEIKKEGFIAFVDSDDYIEPCMIEKMVESAMEYNAEMVVCGAIMQTEFREVQDHTSFEIIDTPHDLMKRYLESDAIKGLLWNKLYRAYLWEDVRFPAWRASEDNATSYKVFDKVNRTVVLPENFYHYVIRGSSTEQNIVIENHFVSIDAAEERYKFITNKYPNLEMLADKNRWSIRLAMYDRLFITGEARKHKAELEMWLNFFRAHNAPERSMEKKKKYILKFPYLYGRLIALNIKIRKNIKKIILKLRKEGVQ